MTPSDDQERADFLRFWGVWPRREAQADAWKAWRQVRAERPPVAEIILAVRRAVAANEWSQETRRFIPLAASWLRGQRWADEFQVPDSVLPSEESMRAKRSSAEADTRLVEQERREQRNADAQREADAAFYEVVEAAKACSRPILGWADARTEAALQQLNLPQFTEDAVRERRGDFVRLFQKLPKGDAPARNLVQLRRAV